MMLHLGDTALSRRSPGDLPRRGAGEPAANSMPHSAANDDASSLPSPPVFKTLVLPVPRALAFELFTRHAGRWWSPLVGAAVDDAPWLEIVLEAQQGGRWFETDVTGAEHQWGTVTECAPPERIVVDWRLTRWTRGLSTELELCFIAIDDQTTRVTLEHRMLGEAMPGQQEVRDAIQRGWTGLLPRFATLCARVADRRQ